MPGMSGTFDHVAETSRIINHSRKQQKSVTITLVDLKNAFGEVHHSIIRSVLRYYCIPDEINRIVKTLYSEFRLSIITNDFYTKYIAMEVRVLQTDSFSPLIFNLIKTPLYNVLKKKSLTLGIVRSKVFFHATGYNSRMTL